MPRFWESEISRAEVMRIGRFPFLCGAWARLATDRDSGCTRIGDALGWGQCTRSTLSEHRHNINILSLYIYIYILLENIYIKHMLKLCSLCAQPTDRDRAPCATPPRASYNFESRVHVGSTRPSHTRTALDPKIMHLPQPRPYPPSRSQIHPVLKCCLCRFKNCGE
jgi:hypothetical protein